MKKPLKVYVVWDDKFIDGLEYAKLTYESISRSISNPVNYGIGIPVDFVTCENVSRLIDRASSFELNVYFFLVDDYFIENKEFWNAELKKMKLTNRKDVMKIPIAYDIDFYDEIAEFKNLNYVNLPTTNKTEYYLFTLAYELNRAVNKIRGEKEDIKLFLSHSKRTGDNKVQNLQNELINNTKLKTFYDSHDIPHGERFDIVIKESIPGSIMVAFLTDDYSSREWCRKEIVIAKKEQSPIILLDYYDKGESRLFPYLGNVRILKVNENRVRYYKLFFAILIENLRVQYYKVHTEYLINLLELTNTKYEYLTLKPELLTMNNLSDDTIYIYPEPPITEDELEILVDYSDVHKFTTPLLFLTTYQNTKEVFKDIQIGISISYPESNKNNVDLVYKIQDIMVNLSRYFVILGSQLYYAGNPNYQGQLSFSRIMMDVVDTTYDLTNQKLINFLLMKNVNFEGEVKDINKLRRYVNLIKVETQYDDKKRNLTNLRLTMVKHIDFIIILGGKTKDFEGSIPGIYEEFKFAIENKKSIYLLGGFGGASRNIVDYILDDEQIDKDLNDVLDRKITLEDLNNGLTRDENTILSTTQEYETIISLLLKGMAIVREN